MGAVLGLGTIAHADAKGCKLALQRTFGSLSPGELPKRTRTKLRDALRGGNGTFTRDAAGTRSPRTWLRFGPLGSCVRRVHALGGEDPDRPKKPAFAESVAELSAHAVARVCEDITEPHAAVDQPIDLRERDLPLRSMNHVLWDIGALTPHIVLGPALGQKESKPDCNGDLIPGQRHRDQHLAVGLLSKSTAVLMRDSNRQLPLLGQSGVVD